ncbi:hypothetical protein BC831DRAFT_436357 [Entophlyctis helioformis]|nr:hypothetical protein BC831DRAFT_436357 [Entophlyctis helioformis]
MPNGPSGSLPPQGPLQDAQLDQGSLQAAHAVQPAHEHEPSAPAEKEPSKESRDAHMADVEASGMATSSSVAELDSETSDKSAIIPGDDASEASRQQDLSADVGMAISTSVESSTSTTDPSQLDKTRDSLHHHAHGHHLPQHMLPQLNIKSLSSKSDRGGQTGPDGEPFSSSVVGDLESSAEFSDRKRVRIDEKYKTWKRTAMIIWNRIADHRAGNAFLKNIRDKEYTDYVKQPMSLDHVKARIREGKTRTTAQFHRDVLHILANAIMFNPEDSEIYAKACEMRDPNAWSMFTCFPSRARKVDAFLRYPALFITANAWTASDFDLPCWPPHQSESAQTRHHSQAAQDEPTDNDVLVLEARRGAKIEASVDMLYRSPKRQQPRAAALQGTARWTRNSRSATACSRFQILVLPSAQTTFQLSPVSLPWYLAVVWCCRRIACPQRMGLPRGHATLAGVWLVPGTAPSVTNSELGSSPLGKPVTDCWPLLSSEAVPVSQTVVDLVRVQAIAGGLVGELDARPARHCLKLLLNDKRLGTCGDCAGRCECGECRCKRHDVLGPKPHVGFDPIERNLRRMSDKKKKGKKDKGEKSGSGGDASATKTDGVDDRTLEYYEAKVRDMTDKVDRLPFNGPIQQDIVEFLNIKVGEHEKMIASLESKTRQLEEEKRDLETWSKNEIESTRMSMHSELEILQIQCAKYKAELAELTAFSAKKDEMEQQIKQYKALLEKKESEYRDTIHNLERKVLQDKPVVDTTKRAIRENMAITSQLKKMSAKTIELLAENDHLTAKVSKLKTSNSLLTESEQELAKRNQANQRVIKMLVEKLKESDQMLELAFESEQLGQAQGGNGEDRLNFSQNGNGEFLTDEMKEACRLGLLFALREIEALQYDYNVLAARLTEVANVTDELELVFQDSYGNVQTEEDYNNMTIDVLDFLRSNLLAMIERLKTLTWFESSENQSLDDDYIGDSMGSLPRIDQVNQDSQEAYLDEMGNIVVGKVNSNGGDGYYDDQTSGSNGDPMDDFGSQHGSNIQLIVPEIRMSNTDNDGVANDNGNLGSGDILDGNNMGDSNPNLGSQGTLGALDTSNRSSFSARGGRGKIGYHGGTHASHFVSSSSNGSSQSLGIDFNMNVNIGFTGKATSRMTGYQQKIEKNFLSMIATIPTKHKPLATRFGGGNAAAGGGGTTATSLFAQALVTTRTRADGHARDVGVQTNPLPFGETANGKYLLSDLRPWGKRQIAFQRRAWVCTKLGH